MKIAFFISALLSFVGFRSDMEKLVTVSEQLAIAAGQHEGRSGFMMDPWDDFSREQYDSLYYLYDTLITRIPSTLLFDMDNALSEFYGSAFQSKDGMVKIFQWEYINGGSMMESSWRVLARRTDGAIVQVPVMYNPEYILNVDDKVGVYFVHGFDQGCSTCFNEYGISFSREDPEKPLIEFGTEDYRHSYFNAGVIQYDPDSRVLSIIYDDIFFEEEAYGEEMDPEEKKEFNECYFYNGKEFISIKCESRSFDRERGWWTR